MREQIEAMGARALVVDMGVINRPAAKADITRKQVAEAGGVPLSQLLEKLDREVAAPVMAEGATRIVSALVANGEVHGIVAMGGTQGTTLATKVMRARCRTAFRRSWSRRWRRATSRRGWTSRTSP